jgi:copper chaperone CopZ
MADAVYTVAGMTCEHCASAVTQELTAIPGVRAVQVDLGDGRVSVTSDGPLALDTVQAAIAEAGYELVDA